MILVWTFRSILLCDWKETRWYHAVHYTHFMHTRKGGESLHTYMYIYTDWNVITKPKNKQSVKKRRKATEKLSFIFVWPIHHTLHKILCCVVVVVVVNSQSTFFPFFFLNSIFHQTAHCTKFKKCKMCCPHWFCVFYILNRISSHYAMHEIIVPFIF